MHSDKKLFELLLLETAQAGLSWSMILKKREGYRRAFDEFDADKVANYDQRRIEQLVADPSVIRNRLKNFTFLLNFFATVFFAAGTIGQIFSSPFPTTIMDMHKVFVSLVKGIEDDRRFFMVTVVTGATLTKNLMTGVSYVSYPYYFYLNMAFSSSSKKEVTDAVVLVVAFVRAEKDEGVEKELIA